MISTLLRHLVQHRVIRAAVAELELEGLAAQRQTENLMAEADAEDRFLADQLANLGGLELERFGIARAVGQEDAVRVQREDVLGGCAGRNDGNVGAHVAQTPKDVALDPEIVRDHVIAFLGGGLQDLRRRAGFHRLVHS